MEQRSNGAAECFSNEEFYGLSAMAGGADRSWIRCVQVVVRTDEVAAKKSK